MELGTKLLDPTYTPTEEASSVSFKKIIKCPVTFTDDPIRYTEEFIKYKLKPIQKTVLEDLFSVDAEGKPIYSHAVYVGGMRCLGLGTEVLMYDGTLKKIENICIGDVLMGPDSKPRKVLDTSIGESELYEVEQSCAMTYVVNEAHILSLRKAKSAIGACSKSNGKKYDKFTDYPDTVNISIGDYLQKSKKWKYFFRGYTAGCINFKSSLVPIDPYFLGVWLGDGNSRQPQITSADPEIVTWLAEYCADIGARLSVTNNKENKKAANYGIRFRPEIKTKFSYPNPVWEEIKKLNLAMNKHIPQCYISNSKEIRLKLLAGLIDTDGHYTRHGYEITLANEILAKDVKRLADSLGYRTNLRKKITTCNYNNFVGVGWRLSIYGDIWEIPCLVERKKYKHTGKFSHKENGLSSLKIKSLGVGPFAGVTVDKDSLYCLSDGTVVHNSGKSILGGIVGSFLLQRLLAFDDPGKEFGQVPGQKFVAEYIATSEQQSKNTAFAAFETILMNTPWWRKYLGYLQDRENADGRKESLFQKHERKIMFHEKNLEAHSLHSNSSSIAGFTAFYVCFDEMSRFDVSEGDVQQKSEKRSAQAVYFTAARAAKTLHGFSKIVTITSPMYETDFGMQLLYQAKEVRTGKATRSIIDSLRMRYPKRDNQIIGYHMATWEANPLSEDDPSGYTEDDFVTEKNSNYSTFLRDFMAIPPSAISPFFELPERIEKSVVRGRNPMIVFKDEIITEQVGSETRNYIGKRILGISGNKMRKHFICCDQGAVKDSFVVAMGHGEEAIVNVPDARGSHVDMKRHKVVIDFIEAWKPNKEERITVSFQNVEEVIRSLNSAYYIDKVVFDQWHSTESIERLFSEGVVTRKLGADIEMYETMKVLVYSGMVELPENDVLLNELRQLTVIKGKRIEHTGDGSKDLADAVCRVVWSVYVDSIRDAIHGNFMLPMAHKFPTTRSVASAFELMKNDQYNEYGIPHFGIFPGSGTSKGVFGKSMIVEPNVIPTIGENKLR
jgi:hypothetical protein